jgi:hypothetical protein
VEAEVALAEADAQPAIQAFFQHHLAAPQSGPSGPVKLEAAIAKADRVVVVHATGVLHAEDRR